MNFKELMSRFEKCYGIHVIIENPKLTDYICSGKFRISDGIDKALHILQKDAKYTFERNKDESVIYIKYCLILKYNAYDEGKRLTFY